jgi:hypothetical protein
MHLNRRSFLAVAAATAVGSRLDAAPAPRTATKKQIKLGISTYSYWHFKTERVPVETVIDKAAVLGVEGVDILHRQMDIPEKEPLTAAHRPYLQKLKRHAFTNGIDLICLSIHQDFVDPSPEYRGQQRRLYRRRANQVAIASLPGAEAGMKIIINQACPLDGDIIWKMSIGTQHPGTLIAPGRRIKMGSCYNCDFNVLVLSNNRIDNRQE